MRVEDLADVSRRDFVQQEPIAIIGLGCRYSGGIENLEDFWRVLIEKKSTLHDVPMDRFVDSDNLFDLDRGYRKMVSKRGGWLENLREFDAKFFNISPREAEKVDPHQRLMLEVTYQAFEDAGLKLEDVWGSRTGVYAGMWSSDFEHVLANSKDDIDVYSTTGSGRYAASGRLAYFFNLQGPTFTVDTACSTSLVAIHLASQSLHLKECDLAVCSAANLILDPFISIGYSRSRLLSDYGKCRFGAVDPGGYVRTEGAATVILKRLSEAERDGDFIYGVIPGSACNSDGQSHKHMLAPSAITQEVMIRDAMNRARIEPKDVQYVEAHGTGTKAGDPVEISSISAALNEGRNADDKFYVGSIKTNLGHTEAASGLAGLLKVLASIQNRTIPANLYADEEKNPNIPWGDLLLEIPSESKPWPKPDQPLIAGLNSFGISGTNAHLIIKEAVERKVQVNQADRDFYILPISAANEKALKEYCKLYLPLFKFVQSNQELLNLVKNVAIRKADLHYRAAIIFQNKEEVIVALENIIEAKEAANIIISYNEERNRTTLVFPGQGGQWAQMGSELYKREPIFKKAIDDFEKACNEYVSWSLTEELFREDGLQEIDIIQPALLAIEIALAEWWKSIGLDFKAVVGHSMGEVGAAYIAGALSIQEAAAIICTRSQLMKKTSGQGAMGYIALPPSEVMEQIKGVEHLVGIGVQNSPSSCVISGEPTEIDRVVNLFEEQGVFARKVKVDVASHSYQMEPLIDELLQSIQWIDPSDTELEIYSSVQGKRLDGSSLNAHYWTTNLRNTVEYSKTIQSMIEDGYKYFVEVSPHPTLVQPTIENGDALEQDIVVSSSLEREKDESYSLIYQVASYFAHGGRINWKKYYDLDFEKVQLPSYPWQRVKYWVDQNIATRRLATGDSMYPFLMHELEISSSQNILIWETEIDLKEFSYLQDHKIQDAIVFPGAGYIEMIWEAVRSAFNPERIEIRDLVLQQALPLHEDSAAFIQIIIEKDIDHYIAQINSKGSDEKNDWIQHAEAKVYLDLEEELELNEIESKRQEGLVNAQLIDSTTHYAKTYDISLPYGSLFQTVSQIQLDGNWIQAQVTVHEKLKNNAARYGMHPTVLDGFIQVFLSAVYHKHQQTFIPVSISRTILNQAFIGISSGQIWIEIKSINETSLEGNAIVFNEQGEKVIEFEGFRFQKLQADSDATEDVSKNLYVVKDVEIDQPVRLDKRVLLFAADDLSEQFIEEMNPLYIVRKGDIYSSNGKEFIIDSENNQHYADLMQQVHTEIDTIVHTWNIDEKSVAGLSSVENTTFSLVRSIQSLAQKELSPRLWVMTDSVEKFPAQSMAIGLLHVVRNEHPEFKASSVQVLDENYSKAINIILSDTPENSWKVTEESFFVERLDWAELMEKEVQSPALIEAGNQSFEVVIDEPGVIDNLVIRKKYLPKLQADEVRVSVKGVGVNFMNLMSVLGIYPGKENGFGTLGIECAGVISEVGENVQGFKVGDRVFGMAYHTLASEIDVKSSLLQHIPEHLSFEEAATIPVVYLTSYYGLIELANLQAGERVLIHAGTGGVGLAAIQIAQYIGAEVYATAGNDEKREYLKNLGVKYIYNSRTLDFYQQILKDTNREGVDVVLNSLTGDAMRKSMDLLRSFGRFVEIGKKDIYDNTKVGLEIFGRGLSYFMIDFEKIIFERPQLAGGVLGELLQFFESKSFTPLPSRIIHVSKVQDAFSYMSESKHIGKIVIQVDSKDVWLEQKVAGEFRENATYILTGGYGGLGLTFAQYLIDKGARRLVLTGRSGQSNHPLISEWRENGVDVVLEKADASEREDIERVFLQNNLEDYPIEGIFHLAGILDDSSLLNLNEDSFYRVLSPKVLGAYNLHIESQAYDIKHFVLFSSSTILFGSPGQAAYVAANSYMDALALYRERLGLAATSIQWGTVSDVGLAASAENRSDRLLEEGVAPSTPLEIVEMFELITQQVDESVVGAFKFDVYKWGDSYSAAQSNKFYDILRSSSPQQLSEKATELKETEKSILLSIVDAEERALVLEEQLKVIVGRVVKMPSEDLHVKTSFKSLGIDSLMTIQLKNQLEKIYEVGLSVTAFWTHPNIKSFATFLIGKMNFEEVKKAELKPESEPEIQSQEEIEDVVQTEKVDLELPKELDSKQEEVSSVDLSSDELSLDDLSKLLDDELDDLLND